MRMLPENRPMKYQSTECEAARAYRYGLESGQCCSPYYGYIVFDDGSMMTNIGVYESRRDAFRHSEMLYKALTTSRGIGE